MSTLNRLVPEAKHFCVVCGPKRPVDLCETCHAAVSTHTALVDALSNLHDGTIGRLDHALPGAPDNPVRRLYDKARAALAGVGGDK